MDEVWKPMGLETLEMANMEPDDMTANPEFESTGGKDTYDDIPANRKLGIVGKPIKRTG